MATVKEQNLLENRDNHSSPADDAVDEENEASDGAMSEKEGIFTNPVLSHVERRVAECNQLFEDLSSQPDEERKKRYEHYHMHISENLQEQGRDMKAIVELLESLIVPYQDEKVRLKRRDENAEVAIVCQSIASYLSTLSPNLLDHLSGHVFDDVTLWLSKLFRFPDGLASFHDNDYEGFVCAVKLALHEHYPNYATNGFNALYAQPPVIYLSGACKQGLREYLCHQTGLPLSSVTIVPTCTASPSSMQKMDVGELEKLIADDVSRAHMPVLLLAFAGTPWLGQVDNLGTLTDVCKKHNIWLHVRGHNLASLVKYLVPDTVLAAKSVNSIDLNLAQWLGLPAVPHVTLFRTANAATASMSGLATRRQKRRLMPLSLWVCLQNLGIDGLTQRVGYSLHLAKKVRTKVQGTPSLKEVITYEEDNAVVVFRYTGPPGFSRQLTAADKDEGGDANSRDGTGESSVYLDNLNAWLFDSLSRDVPALHLSLVLDDIPSSGSSIRYSPAESANMFDTSVSDIDDFIKSLDSHLAILDVTLCQTDLFANIVSSYDCLRSVRLADWCGLGAIQYIPSGLLDKANDLDDAGRKDVNTINSELVHQLKSSDGAFSLGTTADQLACVRFGLITPETRIEELVQMVFAMGRNIEESSKFVESMAEVVRDSIEKANIDLQKQAQDKIMQEGVLRMIPVVGSLLNWWSPPAADAVPRGRSFNLASGKIESTERVYKFHMQLQEADSRPATPLASPKSTAAARKSSLSSTDAVPASPPSPSSSRPQSTSTNASPLSASADNGAASQLPTSTDHDTTITTGTS